MINKQITNKDFKTASDIAETIIHFRQECGCFPTIMDIKRAINTELETRKSDNKIYVILMTEDIIREADEWYDNQSLPD